MTKSNNQPTAEEVLGKILTRQNGLHGVQHTIMGGENLAFEHCEGCKETKQALLQHFIPKSKVREANNTGLKDVDGTAIKLGDKLHKLYVTPLGDLTDDLDDPYSGLGEVTFENGAFCLRVPSSPNPIPLHHLLKKSEGEYVPNYGYKTVYTDTVIARIQPTPLRNTSNSKDRR